MADAGVYRFGPFRLDSSDERLWRETLSLRLTAKAFAILHYLVAHAGQLVTKEDLFESIWTTSYGSEASLTSSIRDIRRTLGDPAQAPQFIETVRGRGYRFIAPVTSPPLAPDTKKDEALSALTSSTSAPLNPPIVGRDAELTQLQQSFDRALQGERQVNFLMGEAGIGKTTLAEAFLSRVALGADAWVGYGQCIQQHGAGEAYLPLLEALDRLCRGSNGTELVSLLRQQAPSWLAQLPSQLSVAEREALYHQGSGLTQERMLRELAEVVETLTASHPLILVLEDLQWSDPSTLEWLGYMARRRDAARVLVVATYRPVDAIVHTHPAHALIQELRVHRQCHMLALDYWSEIDISAYLAQQYAEVRLPTGFLRFLHRRTSGNPLFVVTVMEEFTQQGLLRQDQSQRDIEQRTHALAVAIPDSLRQLIEHQFAQVSPEEQELLEAASVVGNEFSVAAVEALTESSQALIEARYANLARREQFVHAEGLETWPDGTVAARYRFIHALYQEVIYARISPGRCLELHQKIGARKEAGYGLQAREIAAELATHFVRGQNGPQAVRYLQYAGENALRQSAHQEALVHLKQGLTHLPTLPETYERTVQEIGLQSTLGSVLSALNSSTSSEVESSYARARVLCQHLREPDTPMLLPILRGLWFFHVNRTNFTTAQEIGEELLSLAQRLHEPLYALQASVALGNVALWLGDFVQARHLCEQALSLFHIQQNQTAAFLYGEHPKVQALICMARTLWYLGYPTQALQRIQQANTLAEEIAHPISLAITLYHSTVIHRNRRAPVIAAAQAQKLIAMHSVHAFALWEPASKVELGWSQVVTGQEQTGLRQIHQGLTALTALKADIFRPAYCLLMAEAYGTVGKGDKGLPFISEAQMVLEAMASSHTHYLAAEISRIKGELLLQLAYSNAEQAETAFHHALTIARHQHAKSWELRAAISLSRLWQQQNKQDAAFTLLSEVCNWFTEGFDTPDWQDAQILLAPYSAP